MGEFPELSNAEIAVGAGALGIGLGVAGSAIVGSIRKRRKKRRTRRSKSVRKKVSRNKKRRKLKFGSPAYRRKYLKHGTRRRKSRKRQKRPYTAGKRRDTSSRRIRYTRNNQPYVIMPNGRARFISKKSVSSSRKRSGGRY